MLALIYCRVSQDRAGGRSVEEQEAESRRLCETNGWDVAEVVTDSVGASRHSKGTRTGWVRARELLQAGDVDVLVTWEASRAQRDLAAYSELRDLCVRTATLWSYSGRTHDLSTADDRFRTGIDALMAEREADETAERVQRAMRANAIKGRPHGRRLFGYRRLYDPDNGSLVGQEPDPEEAPIVRRIFSEFLSGSGMRTIAKSLNADLVTTGTGARWMDSQVKRVLRNPAYAARRVHLGKIVGDANWPELVDRDAFDRAQARLDDIGSRHVKQSGTARLLTGVGRCECGAKLAAGHDRRRRKVYQCRDGFHVARDLAKLDAYVTAIILERLARQDVADGLDSAPIPAAAEARRRVEELRRRLDDAVSQFTAGKLTAATLARIESELLDNIAAEEREMRRTVLPLDIDVPAEGLDEWWDDVLTPEQRREIVAAYIAAVVVHPTRRGSRTFDPAAIDVEWRA